MAKIIVTANGFVNVDNIVSIFVSDYSISYTSVVGTQHGGYSLDLVKGTKEQMQVINNELIEFFTDSEKTLYNAISRVREMQNKKLYE